MTVSIPVTLLSKKRGFQEAHLGIVDTDKTCDREEYVKMNTQADKTFPTFIRSKQMKPRL